MKKSDNILIIGIGNNGRQDDGLGWMFLDHLEEQHPNIHLEYKYQLQIEDADLITKYDRIIFVDATKEKTEDGYYLRPCKPSEEHSFSTHALNPETIMFLSNKLYGHYPKAYIFAIQGFDWKLRIGLSNKGYSNLEKAKKYFKDTVLIDYL